jgi:ketosteroid isomerase-like protein
MDDDLTRRLHTWIDGYIQAWNSNDPAAIGALFTHDAAYYTEPYRPPWQGRDEIVRRWLDRKDAPGETEFRWHPLAVSPDLAVVQGETLYRTPPRPTATCGSSGSTPRAAAPSSLNGGCSTLTATHLPPKGQTPHRTGLLPRRGVIAGGGEEPAGRGFI